MTLEENMMGLEFWSFKIRVYTYTGNGIETTKFRIIWSQNVHFVTALMVPLKKTYLTKVVEEYLLMN